MQTFTVVYRTGGFNNPKWTPTIAFEVLQDAERTQRQIKMAGREAIIYPTEELEKVGLPQGWEPQQKLFTTQIKSIQDPEAPQEKNEAEEMIAACQAVPMPTQDDLKKAKKLRDLAEGLIIKIADCFSDRQENTPKRQCQAMYKRNEGTWLKRTQKKL